MLEGSKTRELSGMTCRGKLAEAQFFLDKLRPQELGSSEFRFYASAFAFALHSSLQHLLYDYANKYWPQIGRDDYLDPRYFRLLAKATGNNQALRFVDWYNGLIGRINADNDTRLVWDIRQMEAHRGSSPLSFEKVMFEPAIDISDNFEFGIIRPSHEFISTGSDPPARNLVDAVQHSSSAVYFRYDERERPNRKQVPDVFGSSLRFVENILNEAEAQFGAA